MGRKLVDVPPGYVPFDVGIKTAFRLRRANFPLAVSRGRVYADPSSVQEYQHQRQHREAFLRASRESGYKSGEITARIEKVFDEVATKILDTEQISAEIARRLGEQGIHLTPENVAIFIRKYER